MPDASGTAVEQLDGGEDDASRRSASDERSRLATHDLGA